MSAVQKRLELSDFEARYRADPDPWGYQSSAYERQKYHATLAACGSGPFSAAVELGASIGVFSALLAPHCQRLVTLDYSPTAVHRAHARLVGQPNAEARVGRIPRDLPDGRLDLIVASEILYYLTRAELAATIEWLGTTLVPGGRVVCVHWRPAGSERPLTAQAAHDDVAASPGLTAIGSGSTTDYLLDVFRRHE